MGVHFFESRARWNNPPAAAGIRASIETEANSAVTCRQFLARTAHLSSTMSAMTEGSPRQQSDDTAHANIVAADCGH